MVANQILWLNTPGLICKYYRLPVEPIENQRAPPARQALIDRSNTVSSFEAIGSHHHFSLFQNAAQVFLHHDLLFSRFRSFKCFFGDVSTSIHFFHIQDILSIIMIILE